MPAVNPVIKNYCEVPTYENGVWGTSVFATRDDFRDYLVPLFKEPGEYNFDHVSLEFNAQAKLFSQNKVYPGNVFPFKSKDFKTYWDDQKNKCRVGVIYKSGDNTWYLTRDYYMWLNFLPIYDKEEKEFGFAKVRDAQYHIALYEILAELHYEHVVILKKRQIASSYFHMGKLINQFWFEKGVVLKLGASLKTYIDETGSWKFLDEYRDFLNLHTAWYRPGDPYKTGTWNQRIKERINGRDTYTGNKSTITGTSFEKDPTNGVGGPCTIFFHEEGGIAPKMDQTYGFMQPAMQSGFMTTGLFIAAGSVGDLDACGPLKTYVLNPKANGFREVYSNLIDKTGTIGKTGLFIPEQWSMLPYIDEFGNSLVKEALDALDVYFAEQKKLLEPAAYQLKISQRPRNIEEAFAYRKESVFPQHLVSHQLKRIEDGEYGFELLDIVEDMNDLDADGKGKPKFKQTNKIPIDEFPITKKTEDKSGCPIIWERPIKDAPWGTYYGSIDPVGEGKTTTSDSLCSIIIFKNAIQYVKNEGNGKITNYIEPEKIVATWCGRFDDINKTHKRLELLIRMYNAWTICENNVGLFILYMIMKNLQKYLVPKDQMLFLKELGSNSTVYADYGWKNTGNLFKAHLLSYGIEYTKEELSQKLDDDGNVISTTFGIERITDKMIMKEMQAYGEGVNVDRLVAYCSLIAFIKVQQANRAMTTIVEKTSHQEIEDKGKYKWTGSAFRHVGGSSGGGSSRPARSGFKNLR